MIFTKRLNLFFNKFNIRYNYFHTNQLQNINNPLKDKITQRILRHKFLMMKVWSNQYQINNFPQNLQSLIKSKPTQNELFEDYQKILYFVNHPAYIYFFIKIKKKK